MPHVTHGEGWELGLRAAVRTSTTKGWAIRDDRGIVRLLIRMPGHPPQSVGLPFDWARNQVVAITARVRNIYVLTLEGLVCCSGPLNGWTQRDAANRAQRQALPGSGAGVAVVRTQERLERVGFIQQCSPAAARMALASARALRPALKTSSEMPAPPAGK